MFFAANICFLHLGSVEDVSFKRWEGGHVQEFTLLAHLPELLSLLGLFDLHEFALRTNLVVFAFFVPVGQALGHYSVAHHQLAFLFVRDRRALGAQRRLLHRVLLLKDLLHFLLPQIYFGLRVLGQVRHAY